MADMIHVTSSFIESLGWEADSPDDPKGTGTVTVEFRDGARFDYIGPTFADFEEFLSAPSIGKFFHSNWKRRFTGVRA